MTTQLPQPNNTGLIRQYIAHQQTTPYRVIPSTPSEPIISQAFTLSNDTYPSQVVPQVVEEIAPSPQPTRKPPILRAVAIALVCILALSMYLIWRISPAPATATGNITQQSFSVGSTPATSKTALALTPPANTTKIQVYIVGAVKNPGVYTLDGNARVYQLLQAAGGPLPQANLVALNLAARLNDGQEVYITQIGETPPVTSSTSSTSTTNTTVTTSSQININTASANELRLGLHISNATAQAIITYRLQHSSFTSVEELAQVVSATIYKKIKDEVKLS